MVSIIVPVYNAEAVLPRCIDSILKQTYRDFELILMDDGSTDSSAQILDEYAAGDERIRVIHKENSGVSDTRNQGIALAEGEYIQFLDSDDWMTPDATGLFVHTMETYHCDMVIADFYRVIGERVSQKGAIDQDGLMDQKTFAEQLVKKPADFYYGVLWNKFFRKKIIDEYHLKMDEEISWCEDFIFNMQYVLHAKTIYALKVPVYYYVKTKGSLVSQGMSMKKTIQMKQVVFQHYNDFSKEIFGEEEYEKKRFQVYHFLIDAAGDGELLPAVFPGNYKLGRERTGVSAEIRMGEGFFFDVYRERKLQERLFEIVALRNDLSTDDVKLLYYLSQSQGVYTYQEVTSMLNISRTDLTFSLRKLQAADLIKPEKKKKRTKKNQENLPEASEQKAKQEERQNRQLMKTYMVTPEADIILSEVFFVLNDFEQMQYESFTTEEIELFERLNEKRNQNIRRALL